MKRKSVLIAAATALLTLGLLLYTQATAPLPKPEPYAGLVPSATPPEDMAVFALITGVDHRSAAYGYRGGSFFDRRDYAFVGDLVWQLDGITLRQERAWYTRVFADLDAAGTRENLLRMIAIKERLPGLIIVPAHDMRAFEKIPELSGGPKLSGGPTGFWSDD